MLAGRHERLRLVGTTVVLTSLAWIAGIAVWAAGHGGAVSPQRVGGAAAPAPAPVARLVAPTPTRVAGLEVVERLAIPVAGVPASALTDTFTQARAGGERVHDAIDIMAPRGTLVTAAAPGRVEKLFLSKDGGNTVYVRSPDGGLLYYYAHLDSYAPGLAEGQAVTTGTPLGTVGSTGNANPEGPHLHFAVMATRPGAKWYEPTTALNPYPLLTGK